MSQKDQLESFHDWAWNSNDAQWNKSFNYLLDYHSKNGHCNVPPSYITKDGFKLGRWVINQRSRYNLTKGMTPIRPNNLKKLKKLGFNFNASRRSQFGHTHSK